jgi:hypothetical protein
VASSSISGYITPFSLRLHTTISKQARYYSALAGTEVTGATTLKSSSQQQQLGLHHTNQPAPSHHHQQTGKVQQHIIAGKEEEDPVHTEAYFCRAWCAAP